MTSSAMTDWIDEMFDESPGKVDLDLQHARSYAARLVRNSVDTYEKTTALTSRAMRFKTLSLPSVSIK